MQATSPYLNKPLRSFEEAQAAIHKFHIGQWVRYRGAWGRYTAKPCTITGIGEKNGKTVYDNSLSKWGYEDQYEAV
jgi:hypothetical protein